MTDFAAQGSSGWFAARAGKATCSRFVDVLAKLKTGAPAKARETYKWELVVERVSGAVVDHFTGTATQWGTDQQGNAIMRYEAHTGAMVEEAGFIPHAHINNVGGSPDGLIGLDGGVETKCPFNSAIHLQTFLNGMSEDHMPQVQGLMWVTGRKWWDFLSYDPRLPEPYDIYVERIVRDSDYILNLAEEVDSFLAEVQKTLDQLGAK